MQCFNIKIFLSVLIYLTININAQSLNGITGHFKIPSAYISKDAAVSIGASIFNKKYQTYSEYNNHVGTAYILLGFLPRLELSLRITRKIDSDYSSHVMDRMLSGKVLIFAESGYLPAFSFGVQNPYSTDQLANHFNSTYFVISKTIELTSYLHTGFTLGRGFDWIIAADYEFIGFFGGAEISACASDAFISSIIIENNGSITNMALKLFLFQHFTLLIGYEGMSALSVGTSILINL